MQYDFNLGANGVVNFDVKGTFVRYKNGSGPIRIKMNGGGYIDMKPGQGIRGVNFNTVSVQDRSGSTNTGYILAGDYEFTDDTITGSVEVIDGGRNRVKADTAFIGWFAQPAVAAQYQHVQLNNPAGSGKNLIMERLVCASTATGAFEIRQGAGQIGTLSGYGQSKLLRGTVLSTGEVRQVSQAAKAGPSSVFLMNGAVGQSVPWVPVEPIVLPPGYSLTVVAQTQNVDLSVSFEWYEEPV